MENIIVILVLLAIIGLIIWYLVAKKKRGEKCICCPYAKQCKNNTDCKCNNENK